MGKIDEMFKDNEKIIIDTLKQIRNSLYVKENFYEWQVAIDKILDLYNKEKEKNKKIEDKIKMETNRLKEHGYWEFLEQRDLDKTISIIQNLLEE